MKVLKIGCQNIIRYETHTERAVSQQSGDAVILHFFYQEGKGTPGNNKGQNDVNNIFHNKNRINSLLDIVPEKII